MISDKPKNFTTTELIQNDKYNFAYIGKIPSMVSGVYVHTYVCVCKFVKTISILCTDKNRLMEEMYNKSTARPEQMSSETSNNLVYTYVRT